MCLLPSGRKEWGLRCPCPGINPLCDRDLFWAQSARAPTSGNHQSLYLPHYPGPHSRLRGALCKGVFLWATQMVSGRREVRAPSGGPSAKWPNRCMQDSWACHQLGRCPGNLYIPPAVSTTSPGATGASGREEGWCGRAACEHLTRGGRGKDARFGVTGLDRPDSGRAVSLAEPVLSSVEWQE